jgi:hypothetical protein
LRWRLDRMKHAPINRRKSVHNCSLRQAAPDEGGIAVTEARRASANCRGLGAGLTPHSWKRLDVLKVRSRHLPRSSTTSQVSAIALYARHPMLVATGEQACPRAAQKKRRRTEVSVPTVGDPGAVGRHNSTSNRMGSGAGDMTTRSPACPRAAPPPMIGRR